MQLIAKIWTDVLKNLFQALQDLFECDQSRQLQHDQSSPLLPLLDRIYALLVFNPTPPLIVLDLVLDHLLLHLQEKDLLLIDDVIDYHRLVPVHSILYLVLHEVILFLVVEFFGEQFEVEFVEQVLLSGHLEPVY